MPPADPEAPQSPHTPEALSVVDFLPAQETRPEPWRWGDLIVALAILGLGRSLSLLPREWIESIPVWASLVTAALMQLFLFAYPFLLAFRRGRLDLFRWPGAERFLVEAATAVGVLIGLVVLLFAVGLVLQRLAPRTSLMPEAFRNATSLPQIALVAAIMAMAVILAPICEEIFFRGFLQSVLRSRLPVIVASIAQSALFAALHTFGSTHAVAAFFLGLILTGVREWRQSLLTPMLVHAGNNSMAALALAAMIWMNWNSPVLGVLMDPAAPENCRVGQVVPDSAAAKAGIAAGDVILEVSGRPVADSTQMRAELGKHAAGEAVTIAVDRQGERLELRAVLQKRPQAP